MIRYLEIPDLHWSPSWIDSSRSCLRRVIDTAYAEHVDFALFCGDLFDRAVLCTDEGSINDLISMMRELASVCPVYAVYGTPSHDYKGCYGPLEQAGALTVLKPGRMEAYFKPSTASLGATPDCLLFGIPEVTAEWYEASHPTTDAHAVCADAERLVTDMIRNEIAPMRSKHPDVPAVCAMHGNVSDASDRGADPDTMRGADIIIRTDDMAEAGMTRWALGHIHTPWESQKICAGYMGFAGNDRNPWGKTGFVPAFGLVEMPDAQTAHITRVPYGTPERIKITEPMASYDAGTAYWLDTADADAVNPADAGAHPWSRVTHTSDAVTERRVAVADVESARTLADLARMYDKDVTDSQIDKLDQISRDVERRDAVRRDVSVDDVTVNGCIFWGGRQARIDVSHLPTGLVQVTGPNGSGKSSMLGFCTPYPAFVGKDTDSGRQSALKDFFCAHDSGIIKHITCNGQKHEHVISIKGADTKSPKCECYLTIDGVPQLEKATFDAMSAKCEELYGPMTDYVMTSFYVQPLQGSAESGLMTANMSTVRDMVQNIAGIDHSAEKRYALDRASELEAETRDERVRIDTERSLLADTDALESSLADTKARRAQAHIEAEAQAERVKAAEAVYAEAKARADAQAKDEARRFDLMSRIMTAEAKARADGARADELERRVKSAEGFPSVLAEDDRVKALYTDAVSRKAEADAQNAQRDLVYSETARRMAEILAQVDRKKAQAQNAYAQAHAEWERTKSEASMIAAKRSSMEQRIADIGKPCPNCGYIAPEVQSVIDGIRRDIESLRQITVYDEPVYSDPDLSEERREYGQLARISKPSHDTVPLPGNGMSADDRERMSRTIADAVKAEAEAHSLRDTVIPAERAEIERMTAERDAIHTETVDVDTPATALAEAKRAMDGYTSQVASLDVQVTGAEKLIADTEASRKALEVREGKMRSALADMADWQYIADMLSPAKMPAMELDAILDGIDREATRRVAGYRDGRYMFRTVTQKDGKAGTVDKFDIMVRDAESGSERSLLKHSVGEKSFLCACYTEALVKARMDRSRTRYEPRICDEADSFIEISGIPSYYEMMRDGRGGRTLIVSHSPDAGTYIDSKVDIGTLIA